MPPSETKANQGGNPPEFGKTLSPSSVVLFTGGKPGPKNIVFQSRSQITVVRSCCLKERPFKIWPVSLAGGCSRGTVAEETTGTLFRHLSPHFPFSIHPKILEGTFGTQISLLLTSIAGANKNAGQKKSNRLVVVMRALC